MGETAKVADLSPREFQIARAYAGGASYREIAEKLYIAPTTVRTHLGTVYRKLGVSSKIDLLRVLENGETGSAASASGADSKTFPDRPSIAVLPFVNMSGDPEQEFFADGLTEDLITRLSYLRDLLVIARTSTFALKGRAIRVQDAAQDLGVDHVLEGSVRKAGNRIRVSAQLIDCSTGGHIWAQKFDRVLTDIFAVQDEITHAIVVAMQIELTDGVTAWPEVGRTQNLDAWENFLQGVAAMLQYTKEENLAARRRFRQALTFDPDYLDAKVYLAWTHWIDICYGHVADPDDSMSNAEVLLEEIKTTKIPSPSAKHCEAGFLLIQRHHDKALEVSRTAVQLGPCRVWGYTPAAMVHRFCGDVQAALDLLRTTIRLAPFCPPDTVYHYAYALSWLGDHEGAIQAATEYVRRVPRDLCGYMLQAIVYDFAGDYERARAAVGDLRRMHPTCTISVCASHEYYKDPSQLNRIVAALHKAGLPE